MNESHPDYYYRSINYCEESELLHVNLSMRKLLLSIAEISAKILPTSFKKAIYRIDPLAGFIRRELNRAAPQGLTKIQVAAGELAGIYFLLDLQTEKDYWLGTYEQDLQQAIREFVEPGSVVYDIGANIGYITMLLADAVGIDGQVYAFEALPMNLQRLRENLRINKVDERVIVIPGAVADRSGFLPFLIGPSNGMGKLEGSAGRALVEDSKSIGVPSFSLDDLVYEENHTPPNVIKIDIEGGEVMAIKGMVRLLTEIKPVILMELHGTESAKTTWDTLSSLGYAICRMQSGYPRVKQMGDLDWKAYIVGFPNYGQT